MLRKITILSLLTFAATGTTRAAMRAKRQLDEPASTKRVLLRNARANWVVTCRGSENDLLNAFLAEHHFQPLDPEYQAINARDAWGDTPLHHAAHAGSYEIATLLLACGAYVNARNCHGNTPLHDAAANGKTAMATLLLAHRADVNAQNANGYTPLHNALSLGKPKPEVVALLIAHGAHTDTRGWYCWTTPLHAAAHMGNAELAILLITHGAYVNARTNQGKTPLHYAANEGHTDVVALLIAHGADINARDLNVETPFDIAMRCGHPACAELLRAA